jgi:hypothetical protein
MSIGTGKEKKKPKIDPRTKISPNSFLHIKAAYQIRASPTIRPRVVRRHMALKQILQVSTRSTTLRCLVKIQ